MTKRGFTLVELLLVVAVIGIVTAVTIPVFTRSIRGNRLRSASRSVISAGRYARSMAVLHQREMAVHFNLDAASIEVAPAASTKPVEAPALPEEAPEPEPAIDGETPVSTATRTEAARLSTRLQGVVIEYVESEASSETRKGGTFTVIYSSNGRCTPYTVSIREDREDSDSILINVDALASASTGP